MAKINPLLLIAGVGVVAYFAFGGKKEQGAPAAVPTEEWEEVQYGLRFVGYDVEVTGIADTQTRAALSQFQADNGIPETGQYDPPTVEAMSVIVMAMTQKTLVDWEKVKSDHGIITIVMIEDIIKDLEAGS